jgi:hypothetical protein
VAMHLLPIELDRIVGNPQSFRQTVNDIRQSCRLLYVVNATVRSLYDTVSLPPFVHAYTGWKSWIFGPNK